MVKYAAALGVAVAIQGAAATKWRVVPDLQYPAPDACHPMGNVTYEETWPPCLSQGEVEGQCAPTSDDVTGWTFQRDCMCKGSFFEDAIGCGKCKEANALQGPKETQQWDNIFLKIQEKYCTVDTPASNFGGYWESALRTYGSPEPMADDVRKRSLPAGDVVVEHYYKATKSQGPGLPRPSAVSPKPISPSGAVVPVKNATQPTAAPRPTAAVQPNSVVLYAAATARVSVAVVTGVPDAPAGAKFVSAAAEAKAVVTYGLASMDCKASFVDGFVVPSCGAMTLIPGSDAMVPPAAREGAVDVSRCICATEFLAPKKLTPAPAAAVSAWASASASVNVSAVINIFSPAECVGPCSAPPADAPAQPKEECVDCTPEEKGSPAVEPKPKDAASPRKPAEKAAVEPKPEDAAAPSKPADKSAVKPAAQDAAKPAGHAEAHADVKVTPAANGAVAPPAKPAAPLATGAMKPVPAGPSSRPVTAGAASAYGSAAVLAMAFAVLAL